MTRLFLNKIEKPNEEMFQLALGSSYEYCDDIINTLTDQYGMINHEWKYYGAKSGWTLKMMLKGRNLFFLGPCDGYFRIAFIFGDKAVKAIEHSDISPALIEPYLSEMATLPNPINR